MSETEPKRNTEAPRTQTRSDAIRDDDRLAEDARALFDQPAPDGYLEDWAALLDREEQETVAEELAVLIFRVGSEWLALPTSTLVAVSERRPIHRVPHRHGGVLSGLTNMRGRLTPCVSVDRLLGIERQASESSDRDHADGQDPEGDRRRTVVAEARRGAGWIAFEADEVVGAQPIRLDQLRDVPATLERTEGYCRATFRWRERTIGLLDERRFFEALEAFDR